jgi:imidazole glycerol-phosphate synthase subunit HisH
MSQKIGVLYQGAGNIYSVVRGLRAVGAEPEIVENGSAASLYGKLVLPGVGAFAHGMHTLRERQMIEPIRQHVSSGNPFLGICLGAQLIMESSEEFGEHEGIALIPGQVSRIEEQESKKVPHVGWAGILPAADWQDTALADVPAGQHMYFTHSFVCRPVNTDNILAQFEFGSQNLVASVIHENVTGVQFHPELSGPAGLEILQRFVDA